MLDNRTPYEAGVDPREFGSWGASSLISPPPQRGAITDGDETERRWRRLQNVCSDAQSVRLY